MLLFAYRTLTLVFILNLVNARKIRSTFTDIIGLAGIRLHRLRHLVQSVMDVKGKVG
jgi:hypothetical protein